MASFVNNLRLKEITPGDEVGTWGFSTNINLELIADGFGSGTVQLAGDANETFTMADGSASETRAMLLTVTSAVSLTAARTVTLAPNTVNKLWIVKNSTTGGQSIAISQGSGANVTIANGETKIIYTDGQGSSAAVTDAVSALNLTRPAIQSFSGAPETLAQLQAVTGAQDEDVVLMLGRAAAGDGGGGWFRFDSSDLSTEVAADEVTSSEGNGGVYIAPASDKTGASGAWVRVYDGEVEQLWYGSGNDAFAVTASLGKTIHLQDGAYTLTSSHALAEGTVYRGTPKAVVTQTTNDTGAFVATGLSHFGLIGFTLKGAAASPADSAFSAVSVVRCNSFQVLNMRFEDWMGSAITCLGTSVSRCSNGLISGCYAEKGDVSGTTTGYGVQDNAFVQVYEYCNNITVSDNQSEGEWYCAVLVQDRVANYASRIYDVNTANNIFDGMSNYGIVRYTSAIQTITNIADNGSGIFRITSASHGLSTGDTVMIEQSGDANGIWEVTVVDANTFDLDGGIYSASTSNGGWRPSEDCSGIDANNSISNVQGSRSIGGNKPYGAGIYIQAAGGVVLSGNKFWRTNLETDSETLTPGSIGINGPTGPVTVTGGVIRESGFNGIDIANSKEANILISGVSVSQSDNVNVRVGNANNVTLEGLNIFPLKVASAGTNKALYATDSNNLSVQGVTIRNTIGQGRLISLDTCTDFSVRGCMILNAGASSLTCEAAYFDSCASGVVADNTFDGGASAFAALTVTGTTDTIITGNRCRMTPDGSARPVVLMTGTCTGTVYDRSNTNNDTRMDNSSTGGAMHTRGAVNSSGGKTRQQGDTILNTAPATGGTAMWVKIAASAGGSDWESVTLA